MGFSTVSGCTGSGSHSGTDNEPFCDMLQAHPKSPSMRGGNGGVAFARESDDAGLFVGKVLLRGITFERAGTAILKTVIEWL
jgi:hypothetical protein